jgi:hypothetical protein
VPRVVLTFAFVLTAFALWALPAGATTFYVSPSGSDGAAGTSAATAWRTVGKVNDSTVQPGDTVLFQGGATFGDSPLFPRGSGTATAPITYASYGGGRATIANREGAVWFAGKSHLVFDHLKLTSAGSDHTVFAGSPTGGSSYITISSSVITGSRGVGVYAPTAADSHWTIRDSTVAHLGDSGLILLGGPHLITHNTIADTGSNRAITWGKHGIYSKGPNQTISYNDFSKNQNGQAISIRFHGARVIGNTIHDTPYAIAFFDYDTGAAPQGTSYVQKNRGWNISGYGFYYDGQLDPQGKAPSVDFVVTANSFKLTSRAAEAVNVSPSGSAKVTLADNVFSGLYGSGLRAAASTVALRNVFSGALTNAA